MNSRKKWLRCSRNIKLATRWARFVNVLIIGSCIQHVDHVEYMISVTGDYSDINLNRTAQSRDRWNSDSFSLQDINIHTGLSGQYSTYDSSYLGTPSGIFKVMRDKSILVSELT